MFQAPPRLGTGNLAPQTLIAKRYKIIHKLAQGGMGAVYLVSDIHLYDPLHQREKRLALKEMSEKVFPPDQLEQAVEMFQREARMLAYLEHANLPEVKDLFQDLNKHYLVMTFIEGETLEAILRNKNAPFDLETVMKWTNQLCGVLEYLHAQNPPIIYRDLKLSNLMLETKTGLLKVIDFGIARFQRKRTSKHLKQLGQQENDAGIGTMGYAPPEQWQKGEVTTQADIYSLGVILHQLLTNHDPALTPFNLPNITILNPLVPARLASVLAKAYANNPALRYATITEFQREFMRAWHEEFKGWTSAKGSTI
jgi:serine/threonine-protein kinase